MVKHSGKEVLFLSPADPKDYVEGTIILHASTPRNYTTELQGNTYHQDYQHICPLYTTITLTTTCPFQDPVPQNSSEIPEEQPIQPFQDNA